MPSFEQNFGFAVLEVANELHKLYYANVWIKHKQCVVGILTLHFDSFTNNCEQLGTILL